MNKIGIIITTFMRDELLFKSIESLENNLQDNWYIIVVDQGKLTKEKEQYIKDIRFNKPDLIHYYHVSYDSGLSYCRNFGVQKASELGCGYVIISADSIMFNSSIEKINKLLYLFKNNSELGKIGFNLTNRIVWEGWLSIIPNESFKLEFIDKTQFPQDTKLQAKIIPCNICKNFYIATVKSLLDVSYDENLKLMEHEDHSIRYAEKYNTLWTDLISGEYIDFKPPEYKKLRSRMYREFMQILLKKYYLKSWIVYSNLENAKK